jgi:phosphoglycerate kinase
MIINLEELELGGKKVLIRQDLNVPIKEGVVTSDKRIKASLPTIEMAIKQGAKVMLMSHRGRPTEGEASDEFTLQPVADRLSELLNTTVRLEKDWLEGIEMQDGEVVLCENVRFNVGEMSNDDALSKRMAAMCDHYDLVLQ